MNIRGYGGVAIYWGKNINHAIQVQDGNNRITVITLHAQPKSICLINAYLPSENKEVDEQYKDTLEQISEIIQKFKDTHNMLICGDMNASLHRDNCKYSIGRDLVAINPAKSEIVNTVYKETL